jgi:hypothetical protein
MGMGLQRGILGMKVTISIGYHVDSNVNVKAVLDFKGLLNEA